MRVQVVLDSAIPPLSRFGCGQRRRPVLDGFGKVDQPFDARAAGWASTSLDVLQQFAVDLFVNFRLPGVDDAPMSRPASIVKYRNAALSRFPRHRCRGRERDVTPPPDVFRIRALGLDPSHGFDELDRVIRVLFKPRPDSQDVPDRR